LFRFNLGEDPKKLYGLVYRRASWVVVSRVALRRVRNTRRLRFAEHCLGKLVKDGHSRLDAKAEHVLADAKLSETQIAYRSDCRSPSQPSHALCAVECLRTWHLGIIKGRRSTLPAIRRKLNKHKLRPLGAGD
jgi:hypothetical protein